MPEINFKNSSANELSNRLYGKVDTVFCESYLYFYKSGISQELLHQFKYNNYPEIGIALGKWFGHDLAAKSVHEKFDMLIPVPLHPKKERKRGYNQSQYFVRGISEVVNIPMDFKSLIRTEYQQSQTKKTKEQRWENVRSAFMVMNPKKIENKKILLVDDVITTGATIEACSQQLIASGAKSVGVASLALAK